VAVNARRIDRYDAEIAAVDGAIGALAGALTDRPG